MPYKGGVQLLPETERRPTLASYTSGNRYFWTGVVIGVFVLVVFAILSGYASSLNDQIAKLDGQLDQTEAQRDKTSEQALLDAQQQSRTMKTVLGSKAYWSQALAQMELMMQSSVTLTSLDASATKGTIGFTATAGSFSSVAKQLAAFAAGTGISDISLNSVRSTQGGVEFQGVLTIDTKKLLTETP